MINLITDCHFIKSIIIMHETIDTTASLLLRVVTIHYLNSIS